MLEQTGYTVNGVTVPAASATARRPAAGATATRSPSSRTRSSRVSYVTGSHALKVGFQIMEGWRHFYQEPNGSMDYTFSNGSPLSLTQ